MPGDDSKRNRVEVNNGCLIAFRREALSVRRKRVVEPSLMRLHVGEASFQFPLRASPRCEFSDAQIPRVKHSGRR